ncbi:unnamed protein product [Meloidogyne enterolobii]|uniref:Uncharacterized protein n=1 Tax=Meloidogyne enterolobii TaxID=390850 RepID=A0ACB0ZGH0_MELEN
MLSFSEPEILIRQTIFKKIMFFKCLIYFRESIIFVLDYLNKNNAKVGRVWLYIYGLTGCNQYEGWNKNNKTKNIEYIDVRIF